MKARVEASPLTIGTDNSVLESMQTGKWGVRISFTDEKHESRFEIVLKSEEVPLFINDLQKSLNAIESCSKAIKKAPNN